MGITADEKFKFEILLAKIDVVLQRDDSENPSSITIENWDRAYKAGVKSTLKMVQEWIFEQFPELESKESGGTDNA